MHRRTLLTGLAAGLAAPSVLRAQGWLVPDSQANFVWLGIGENATKLAERCTRAGVLVRPFAGDGVRVSVGEREATDLLLEVTSEALEYRPVP